jgi:chromosome segregation protein
MYLKKLEMLGFKSFADRSELLFQPGMTAVVGPNGCGKSNVVDAFKWIFGAQSAKGMRGNEMKDVIFNGTAQRKPTGLAEVTVAFENTDRFLDIDYGEVAITRRLFRSGESEYLINKQRCRLKDIRGLFMGTGIGQTSYSILEQGKVDALLQANDIERRSIFEEAAGISKYLSKKAETLRALLRVEDNLTRLNDIVAEVEKRLARVKAQASRARRYRTLSERLKYHRIRLGIEDYRKSVQDRVNLAFRLHWSTFRLGELEKLVAVLNAVLEEKSTERREHAESLRQIRERAARERVLKERTRERIDGERRRVAELLEERARKGEDLESTRAALLQEEERIAAESRELETIGVEIATRRSNSSTVQRELDEIRSAKEALEADVRGKKEEVVGLFQERSRVANSVVQLESEIRSLKSQRERLEGTLEGFRKQLEAETQKEAREKEEVGKLKAEGERVENERRAVEGASAEIETALEALEKDLEVSLRALHERRSRYEVLKSLEENLDGVGMGVAEVLRRQDSTPAFAGLHGMAGSFVKVESRFARAVEEILGAHAQALIVETQDGAIGLLEFAGREGGGALKVISLDRVDFIEPEYFPRQAGVLGALYDKVEVPEELEGLFRRLLANVVLVEDFHTALALSRNGLRPFRLVTLAGEVVEPWGGLSRAGESEPGIISRRSEMDDLLEEVVVFEREESSLRQRQTSLRADLTSKREELEALRETVAGVTRSILQAEGNLAQIEREHDRLRREIHVGAAEVVEIAANAESRGEEKKALDAKVALLDAANQAAEEAIRALEEEVAAVGEKQAAAAEALTQARLQLADAETREGALKEMLARAKANLVERQNHVEDLQREIESLSDRHRETEDLLRSSEAQLVQIVEREAETQKLLESGEATDAGLQELEDTYRRELDNVHKESSSVQKEREAAQLRDQEERHRRNGIVERIQEEYGIDLRELLETADSPGAAGTGAESNDASESAVEAAAAPSAAAPPEAAPPEAAPPEADGSADAGGAGDAEASVKELSAEERCLVPDPEWDGERAREEIRELQEKLRRMGSVNLEALDELEELEQRFQFQQEQRRDLIHSEKNLRGIIDEINRSSRDMFAKTFAEIQGHFSELFRKCFGGGKAELVLEEGVDILEAGIDIVAKPPGKKITSLSLMSGGEKTMTTIALLFAIFRTRPSPFCILDEVDAPLDEANVRRFVVLLKDFVSHTQFLVITHNKVTMAEANTLYGVTMQEHGVSNRVSVELETYDPENMELVSG